MAESMTEVTLSHQLVSKSVTMKIPRSLLTQARGGNTHAQDKIIVDFKDEYTRVHGNRIGYLGWRSMSITELTLPGCDCSCARCDIGAHCRKSSSGCDM